MREPKMLEDIFNDKQPNKEDNRTEKEINKVFNEFSDRLLDTLEKIDNYNKYADKKIEI